jgi:ABC-type transport system involved in cytochrome c biogenesis permease subunit
MDVFKLAFETTVVDLLTIGWLGIATHLLFPDFQLDSVVQMLPDFVQKNLAAAGVCALILAYCLGSAILPIANQLVNLSIGHLTKALYAAKFSQGKN